MTKVTTLLAFRLNGIPPASRGVPQIGVACDIDANGILVMGAADRPQASPISISLPTRRSARRRMKLIAWHRDREFCTENESNKAKIEPRTV